MKYIQLLILIPPALIAIGCGTVNPTTSKEAIQPNKVEAPKAEAKISPEIIQYLANYDKGFTAANSDGADPRLTQIWSRIGAAQTCGVDFDTTKVIETLQRVYGKNASDHNEAINAQSSKSRQVDNFCTPERKSELIILMPELEKGRVIQ